MVVHPKFMYRWRLFWTKRSGWSRFGRLASRLAAVGMAPHHGCLVLAGYADQGFVSHDACVSHRNLRLGRHAFLGRGVFVYQSANGGAVDLGDRVEIYGDCRIQTGEGGWIRIGAETHVQAWCNLSAYKGGIEIGSKVEIAPNCAFYSYNHSIDDVGDIMGRPLVTRGGIIVGDGAWLGHGVIVLDGVEIGAGAVVAAGAVVSRSIPSNTIAAGNPARVIRVRS